VTAATAALVAIDTPFRTLAEAEHHLLDLGQEVALPADVTVCTHEIRDGVPHYAFSFTTPEPWDTQVPDAITAHFAGLPFVRLDVVDDGEPPESADTVGLRQTVHEIRTKERGRAVRFPGSAQLVGTMTVGEAVAASGIDRLAVLGGLEAADSDLLVTRDFVRPLWTSGELVLSVMPAGEGSFAPFEVPNPTPCCGSHG
jgi:hypothetical protein